MQNPLNTLDQVNQKVWLTQSDYAKKIRPLLPPEAFVPDQSRVWILLINLAILLAGWSIASYLDQWSWYWLWLYLPFSLVMSIYLQCFSRKL